jgi:chromosome segregation ATPase
VLFVVDLGVYSKGMDVHNVPDVLGRGIKRKASGYEYMRSRQESAEAELEVEKREKDVLLKLLELEKRSVKGLMEQLKDAKVLVEEHECNVQRLAGEVMNSESRVRNLEADNYFMSAELQDLRAKVAKLSQSEKDTRERWKKECLKKRRHKWRTKMKVLRAFEWEENTADPVVLRAVCALFGRYCLKVHRMMTKVRRTMWTKVRRR